MSSDDDRRRREKSAEEEYDYLYETLEQQDYDAITRFHEYLKHFLTYGAYWKTWRGRRRLIKRWSEMSEEEQIAAIAEPGPRSPSPSSSEDGRITKDIIANGEWVYVSSR
ncbi:hypothetical protein BU16DRAFT_342904 [Lophium mytilinum]|uniref:Uncharacterized protein n=1 Tax=Lophium mytilinum TaxID=390894 RepID=A0A6A6QWL1_9PEZI|nr:hypothetical protein BU16DRAFT_342904 [Lophium mytilinum]